MRDEGIEKSHSHLYRPPCDVECKLSSCKGTVLNNLPIGGEYFGVVNDVQKLGNAADCPSALHGHFRASIETVHTFGTQTQ